MVHFENLDVPKKYTVNDDILVKHFDCQTSLALIRYYEEFFIR